jgi:hypothetical protein
MVATQLAGRAKPCTTQRYAHMVDTDLGKAIALLGAPMIAPSGESDRR